MRRVCCFAAALTSLLALPLSSQAQGRQIVVPAAQQGTLICVTGDTLLLGGPDALSDFYQCALSADRQAVPGQQQLSNPNYPYYAFRWTAPSPGTHRLTLDYVLENRSITSGRRLIVQVQSTPPAVLNALPAQFYGAASGKDLPVTVQIDPSFHPAKVDYFLDNQPVGSAASAPYGFVLPLGGQLPGLHAAFIEAIDASGDVYISPIQTVTIVSGSAPGSASTTVASSQGGQSGSASQGTHKPGKPKKSKPSGKRRQ